MLFFIGVFPFKKKQLNEPYLARDMTHEVLCVSHASCFSTAQL